MTDNIQQLTKLMQCHKGIEKFNYDLSVDWAYGLINDGKESDNIYMLASFVKPVDSREIESYVSRVLSDLKLKEKKGLSAVFGKAEYHLTEISNNKAIRTNLHSLYELCLENDYEHGLLEFYLLHLGWNELEEIGVNLYYDGADLNNIERILKEQANKWIENYIRAEKH